MSRPAPLQTAVRRVNDAVVITLHGEIDAFADGPLQEAWRTALAAPPQPAPAQRSGRPASVLLNFADVEYINSTGIAVIVSLLAQAQREGLPLCVCNLSDHYTEIFRITRLTDFMPAFPSEEAALAQA